MDLTLADARWGGSARVTVLKDGEPMADANVGLTLLDPSAPSSPPGFEEPTRSPVRDAIDALIDIPRP